MSALRFVVKEFAMAIYFILIILTLLLVGVVYYFYQNSIEKKLSKKYLKLEDTFRSISCELSIFCTNRDLAFYKIEESVMVYPFYTMSAAIYGDIEHFFLVKKCEHNLSKFVMLSTLLAVLYPMMKERKFTPSNKNNFTEKMSDEIPQGFIDIWDKSFSIEVFNGGIGVLIHDSKSVEEGLEILNKVSDVVEGLRGK